MFLFMRELANDKIGICYQHGNDYKESVDKIHFNRFLSE